MSAKVMNLPPHLIGTMPPEAVGRSCDQIGFDCKHWIHATAEEDMWRLSDEFNAFIGSMAVKAKRSN